jgi:iron complex transport system substrate-binding protein
LPSSTEIICALGLEESLIGVTHECDFPDGIANRPHVTASRISHESMSSKEIDHAVRTQLDGHGSIYDLDEKLLGQLDPELIITQELCDVCAVNYEMVSKSAKIFAADAKIVSLEPTAIAGIFDNIITIGELCGVSERAEILVGELAARLDKLKFENRKAIRRPRVFMLEWLEPPFAPGHWVPEQVDYAGGECLLGTAGKKSVMTTFADIIESNPEVLVLIPCGYYAKDILRQIPQTGFPPEFLEIEAIKNGNTWALDATSYFSRPGPRVVDGAEILAKILQPDLFGKPTEDEAVQINRNIFTAPIAPKF